MNDLITEMDKDFVFLLKINKMAKREKILRVVFCTLNYEYDNKKISLTTKLTLPVVNTKQKLGEVNRDVE